MQKVKDQLTGIRATLTADGPNGEKVTVVIQNNVRRKIYFNISGKEAWIPLWEFKQALLTLYGDGHKPKHARKETSREV